ncbi:MAG: tetratricopeptide repeat protein [Gemmatimonadota bacterium]
MRLRRCVLLLPSLIFASSAVAAQAPPMQQAVQRLQNQDYAGAVEILQGLTAEQPQNARAWLLLGQAHLGAGAYESARAALAEAEKTPATHWQAYYFTGLSYAAEGDLDHAFERLQHVKEGGAFNLTQIGLVPQAAVLRKDPRYASLFPTAAEYASPFVEPVRILRDWRGEAEGDVFGWIARDIGDVDGDGIHDMTTSATQAAGGAGRVYVYSSGSGRLLWSATGTEGAGLGTSIESAGDVDADGIPDVVAGAPGEGAAYVYSGADGRVLHRFGGDAADRFGGGVADVGDLDGDGHDDVIVSAPAALQGAGVARVYSGKDGSVLWERKGEAGEGFGSAVGGWRFGARRAFLVGAPGGGPTQGGRTYVFTGLTAKPDFVVEAEASGAQNGAMFVSILGDVDGDGVPDVYSSDWADGTSGPQTGRVYVHSGASGARLYTLAGEAAGDGFGIGVADLGGDIDGDGLDDVVIGAWQHAAAAPSGGKVYIRSGKDGHLLYAITGRVPGETFGFDATGIGDVDGDGVVDLLLTSAYSAINGTRSGRVLILAGERR